jgi:hypothetical protein
MFTGTLLSDYFGTSKALQDMGSFFMLRLPLTLLLIPMLTGPVARTHGAPLLGFASTLAAV